jgi:ATP-dependent Clp protease ATP-binding subunit ClpB
MGFGIPEESARHDVAASRYEELKSTVLQELREHMAPELLGTIDQVIVFSPLGLADLERITDLHIQDLQRRLQAQHIQLDVSKGVRQEISQRAFQEGKGARPVRRIVQEVLEDPIATSVIAEELSAGNSVVARKTGGKIRVMPVSKAEVKKQPS